MQDLNTQLTQKAINIRKNIINAMGINKSAHVGGSLSCVDILTVLYGRVLKNIGKDTQDRDRFILSKGHCALALYAALAEFGIITEDELYTFGENDSDFPTHIVQNKQKGLEVSSGSLGMGLPFGIGSAIALKRKNLDKKVYVLVGNGELNEGSNWEAIMFAGARKMDNIVVIVDDNKMQNDGYSKNVLPVFDLGAKIEAFGWDIITVDGHNLEELEAAFEKAKNNKVPTAVIANTVKGKGISFMENNSIWHNSKMTEEEYSDAMKEVENVN